MDSISKINLEIIEKEKCIICEEQAECMVRGEFVCDLHFNIFQRDNIYISKRDIDIEDIFIVHKACYRDKCTKRFPIIINQNNQQWFCSDRCKTRDKRWKTGKGKYVYEKK